LFCHNAGPPAAVISGVSIKAVVAAAGRLLAVCAGLAPMSFGGDPALTIYNQNFAVVREILPVDLKAGNNALSFSGVTAHLEPPSVILRDPSGRQSLQILEQNYRNDPISTGRLLNLVEGKTIEFLVRNPDGSTRTVLGRVVRSGYVAHYAAMQPTAANTRRTNTRWRAAARASRSSRWMASCSSRYRGSRSSLLSATTRS
jgi:hypothetical protein